jgi:hypothetical protein
MKFFVGQGKNIVFSRYEQILSRMGKWRMPEVM